MSSQPSSATQVTRPGLPAALWAAARRFATRHAPVLRMVLAVALPVLTAALVWGLYGIRYQTNDDATLANIAAGAYGGRLHLIFVNVLFSALLQPLYALFAANWYVFVQLALMLVALAAIGWLLMQRLGLFSGCALFLALLAALGPHLFYTFQFTESSFLLLTAGLALVAHGLGRFGKGTVLGIALTLFGSMIRWTSFYAVGALSAAVLLYAFFRLDKPAKKKAVLTMVVLFAVVFGAKAVDVATYRLNDGWAAYTEYNNARFTYSDFAALNAPEENPFAENGITDADYAMLCNWDFYDPARFTPELLHELADEMHTFSPLDILKRTAQKGLDMLTGETYNHWFVAAGALSLLMLRPKKRATWALIGTRAVFAVLSLYLVYSQRFPAWVESSLILAVSVFALVLIAPIQPHRRFLGVVSAVMLVVMACASLPTWLQLRQDAPAYAEWAQGEQSYFERMHDDKENLYLLSTEAINVAAGLNVLAPREEGFYNNIVAFGGWLSRTPHREAALAAYGLARPLVDAVDAPNVYIGYHHIDDVERYVEQELGEAVDVVATGQNPFAPYQLVRAQS